MRSFRHLLGPSLLFALLFAAVVALACTRKKAIEPNALTGGAERTWRISEKQVEGKPADISDCERFVLYTFRADGTFSSRDIRGQAPDCPQLVAQGTWRLENDNQVLVLVTHNQKGVDEEIRLPLVRLNYDKLEAQATVVSPGMGTLVLRPVNS